MTVGKDRPNLQVRGVTRTRFSQDWLQFKCYNNFIEAKDRTVEGISKMILNKLQADGPHICNCRSQAYDNAAVMAGKHSRVQQKIKEINPKVEFNVAIHFFSTSTHRWEVLIGGTGKSLKRIQDTRRSGRGDGVNMTWHHYKDILVALEKLTEVGESLNTRKDAGALLVTMQSFSFLCFLGLWQPALQEVNGAQTKGLNIRLCAQKVNALQIMLTEKREEWVDGANYSVLSRFDGPGCGSASDRVSELNTVGELEKEGVNVGGSSSKSFHLLIEAYSISPTVFNSETRSDAEPQPGPSKRLRTE
ncbi:hypothetical protein EVAR_25622_1 [Eumeta japonica]|uniref:DUF4371 domain-containing protein n=1 Tax=Eumeta variegata TaxID=151549 RepID=A0A4C1V253_EUMVA|nr:hypothetical protein EVAR_25622_1 [Eumeta japonica]